MTNNSFWFKLRGWVRGYSAVAVSAILGITVIAFAPLSDWLKLVFGIFLLLPLIGITKRIGWGTEEGSTDLEITPQAIRIANIPLSTFTQALAATIEGYGKLRSTRPTYFATV